MRNFRSLHSGSHLVALGAALWSIDSLFRSRLAGHYSPFLMVLTGHLLCSPITFSLCWKFRSEIRALPWRDWGAFLFLALASNIFAMASFTYAFSLTSNYSVPVLIQKVQPLLVVASATLLLKESLPRRYILFAAMAMAGSILVGFGKHWNFSLDAHEADAISFSFLAATLWGLGTTAGRFVSQRHSFLLVTSLRYALATVCLLPFAPLWLTVFGSARWASDLPLFMGMAYVPGLLALFVYYRGMQVTRATLACWLELAYPVAAVSINWIFLGSALTLWQATGAVILVASITAMNYFNTRRHAQDRFQPPPV